MTKLSHLNERGEAHMVDVSDKSVTSRTAVAEGFVTMDASTLAYTRTYLQTFEKAAASTQTSAELIGRMKQAYPEAPEGLALDIGAKVNKGEMKW